MDYKAEIGRRIRAAREDRGISLDLLSRRTKSPNLSKSRISNYEQGIRMPGPAEANELGRALEVDPAYLLCVQQSLTKAEADLLRNWRALPENDRNDYLRRIQALALVYREPVADERLGAGWNARKGKKKTVK